MTIEYLAGIVDGEGHFRRDHRKNGQGRRYSQSRLVVVNTFKPLIDQLKAQYGGTVSPMRLSLGKKPCWRWDFVGKKCEALARELRPHLIVKAEQVKRVLDYAQVNLVEGEASEAAG